MDKQDVVVDPALEADEGFESSLGLTKTKEEKVASDMKRSASKTSVASGVSTASTSYTTASSYALEVESYESKGSQQLSGFRPEGSAMNRALVKRTRRIKPTDKEFVERLHRIWDKEDLKLREEDTFLTKMILKPLLLGLRVLEFLTWPLLTVLRLVTGEKYVSLWSIKSHERKQMTIIVLYYLLFLSAPLLHLVGLFFVLFPLTTFPMLLYLFYIHKLDGRPENGLATPFARYWSVWKYLVSYFPLRLVKTCNLDPSEKYIFAYHPHGIISFGAFGCFATDAAGFQRYFPGINLRLLTLRVNFITPFLRELILALGICVASREAIQNILGHGPGQSVCLVVGGAAEALESEPGTYRLTLEKRKGFVREALMAGADLVPCIGFGENDIYSTKFMPRQSIGRRVQEFLKAKIGFSTPLFYGRGLFGGFGIFPHRKPIYVVVGKPVKLPRLTEEEKLSLRTTQEGIELVNRCHKKYISALREIWDTYKVKLAVDRQGTLIVNK